MSSSGTGSEQGSTQIRPEDRDRTFLIESSLEFAFIADALYADSVAQGVKIGAEFNVQLSNGAWHQWYWTYSPNFRDKIEQQWGNEQEVEGGGSAPSGSATGSDASEIESWTSRAKGPVSVTFFRIRSNADRGRPSGAFYGSYIAANPYKCDQLRELLSKLQVYPDLTKRIVDKEGMPENYSTPCALNAMILAGVPDDMIQSLKGAFKGGNISLVAITKACKTHGVHLSIRNEATSHTKHYGDKGAAPVYELVLTEGHYIAKIKTPFTRDMLKDGAEWSQRQWDVQLQSQRAKTRGLDAPNLLKYLRTEVPGFFEPITNALAQVHRHTAWSRMDKTQYGSNLTIQPACFRLKHKSMLRRGYVRVLQAPMDRDGAKAFLALSYEQFVEVCGDKKTLEEFERYREVVRRNIEEGWSEYCYTYGKGKRSGRVSAGRLQSLPTEVRGLVYRNTTDIDMSKCHPRILKWVCDKNGIAHPELTKLLANTDDMYRHFGSRDEGKRAMLTLMNKHAPSPYTPEALVPFEDEMRRTREAICALPQYADLEAYADDKKGNKIGSWFNHALCLHENEMIMATVDKLEEEGKEPMVMMYDGVMVEGDLHDEGDAMCDMLQANLKEKFDIHMPFSVKPHDTTLHHLIEPEEGGGEDDLIDLEEWGVEDDLTDPKEGGGKDNLTECRRLPWATNDTTFHRPIDPEERGGKDDLTECRRHAWAKVKKLMAELAVGDKAEAERLYRKFHRLGLNCEQQHAEVKAALKAREVHCDIFFDIEDVPYGVHQAYAMSAAVGKNGPTEVFINRDLVKLRKEALDWMLEQANKFYTPEDHIHKRNTTIRLIAQNVKYDLSGIIAELSNVELVEKGTDVYGGSATYYQGGSDLTGNDNLANWLRADGMAIFMKENESRNPASVGVACRNIRNHDHHIANHPGLSGVKGVGPRIAEVLMQAPPEAFAPSYRTEGKRMDIRFVDSYKHISKPLKDFPKMFGLDGQQKEVMPHAIMTHAFVFGKSKGIASRKKLLEAVRAPAVVQVGGVEGKAAKGRAKEAKAEAAETRAKEARADRRAMFQNMTAWGCEVSPGQFDMVKYSSEYCRRDVLILRSGYEEYRRRILKALDIDINSHMTTASIADKFLVDEGVYESIVEMTGAVRDFIMQCTIGGRVYMLGNKKRRVMTSVWGKKIDDFDAVSLYASAMLRLARDMGGFLKGRPNVYVDGEDLTTADGYFLKIRVDAVGRCHSMPVTRILRDDCAVWTDRLEGEELFVDKITLEELIRYNHIEYTILQGYVYRNGRNDRVGDVIQRVFDERLRLKGEGNPLQEVMKLVLCSSFGKTGQRAVESEVRYINADKVEVFRDKNFHRINEITPMGNGQFRFDLMAEVDTKYNRQHVNAEILSMSKRIVNEVGAILHDMDKPCLYSDTDSLHIEAQIVPELESRFREKYKRELVGKGLGQFHCDFEVNGDQVDATFDGDDVRVDVSKGGNPQAIESIFLGKKSYCDLLVDANGVQRLHFKMKRAPKSVVEEHARRYFGGSVLEFYRHLYRGNTEVLDLTKGGLVFRTLKTHAMFTLENSTLTLKF